MMQKNPLRGQIMDHQNLEEGRQRIEFSDIFQLIENTPNLATQGPDFVQHIRNITDSIQALSDLNTLSETEIATAKQHLQTLLTNIAPHIKKYTGQGILENQFSLYTRSFVESLLPSPPPVNEHTIIYVFFSAAAFCVGLITGVIALTELNQAGKSYDDDFKSRHYHSEERNDRLKKSGDNTGIAAIVFLTLSIIIALIARVNFLQQNAEVARQTAGPQGEARRNMRANIDQLYTNYCEPRKNLDFFRQNTQSSPRYFYELAAKVFAAQLVIRPTGDTRNDDTIGIFRAFDQANTPDGRKFNHLLREATSEELTQCLRRIVTVPVSETLTLQADHIFGSNAADYLLDLITQLREELHLLPWKTASAIDSASPEQLATAIQIYTGGSPSSTLYGYVVEANAENSRHIKNEI